MCQASSVQRISWFDVRKVVNHRRRFGLSRCPIGTTVIAVNSDDGIASVVLACQDSCIGVSVGLCTSSKDTHLSQSKGTRVVGTLDGEEQVVCGGDVKSSIHHVGGLWFGVLEHGDVSGTSCGNCDVGGGNRAGVGKTSNATVVVTESDVHLSLDAGEDLRGRNVDVHVLNDKDLSGEAIQGHLDGFGHQRVSGFFGGGG